MNNLDIWTVIAGRAAALLVACGETSVFHEKSVTGIQVGKSAIVE